MRKLRLIQTISVVHVYFRIVNKWTFPYTQFCPIFLVKSTHSFLKLPQLKFFNIFQRYHTILHMGKQDQGIFSKASIHENLLADFEVVWQQIAFSSDLAPISNFSCMFLNPNNFFLFEFSLFQFIRQLKKHSVTKNCSDISLFE